MSVTSISDHQPDKRRDAGPTGITDTPIGTAVELMIMELRTRALAAGYVIHADFAADLREDWSEEMSNHVDTALSALFMPDDPDELLDLIRS